MIASSFALICFAASCLLGAAAGNDMQTIIIRAGWAMVLCYVVGLAIGALIQRTIETHIEQFKQRHPIPEEQAESSASPDDAPATSSGPQIPSGAQSPGA